MVPDGLTIADAMCGRGFHGWGSEREFLSPRRVAGGGFWLQIVTSRILLRFFDFRIGLGENEIVPQIVPAG
jgi:hypothetical protein